MDERTLQWLAGLLQEMDARVQNAEPLSLSYTLAAILWLPYSRALGRENTRRNGKSFDSTRLARDIVNLQNRSTYISKVNKHQIFEIWRLQRKMQQVKPGTQSIVGNPRFRAAVRLLEHRIKFDEVGRKASLGWIKIRDNQSVTRKRHKRRRYRPRPTVET